MKKILRNLAERLKTSEKLEHYLIGQNHVSVLVEIYIYKSVYHGYIEADGLQYHMIQSLDYTQI